MDYTEVEGQEAFARQWSTGGPPMRQSRPHARGDDGLKRHALRAQQPGPMLQLRGHFSLLDAGPDEAQDVVKKLAAHQRRLRHHGQLVFVLHLA